MISHEVERYTVVMFNTYFSCIPNQKFLKCLDYLHHACLHVTTL